VDNRPQIIDRGFFFKIYNLPPLNPIKAIALFPQKFI